MKKPESVLENTLKSIVKKSKDERKKTEPYKELFKAGSTYTGLLRSLECKMKRHVLDVCIIYKERHGLNINRKQFNLLLALPLLLKSLEANITDNEGLGCSVDKAFFIISEQFKSLDK